MQVNIGLNQGQIDSIVHGLSRLLADTYTLYLNTQNVHWNVTGPMFNTVHLMTEAQYGELALAVDAIAERIRSLGAKAPGGFKAYSELSSLGDTDGNAKAEDMVVDLVKGHEAVARTAREIFKIADGAGDEVSASLLTDRLEIHEKTAWMLRSLIG